MTSFNIFDETIAYTEMKQDLDDDELDGNEGASADLAEETEDDFSEDEYAE